MKFRFLILSTLLFSLPASYAEDVEQAPVVQTAVDYDSILDSIEEAVPERLTTGTIESIDLGGRKAIISGFEYHFGPATEAQPLKVRMLGRDFGALEMLAPGMDVEVSFFQSPAGDRVGTILTQIEEAEVN